MASEVANDAADGRGKEVASELAQKDSLGLPDEVQAAAGKVPDDRGDIAGASQPPLSKNAQKRLLKQQLFLERKERKRQEAKQRREESDARKQKEEEESLATMNEEQKRQAEELKLQKAAARRAAETEKWEAWEAASQKGPGVIIDLEFSDLMTEKELSSLQQQVMFSYALNTKASHPCRLTLSGCDGSTRERLSRISGFDKWHLTAESRPWAEAFRDRLSSVVYLTADSPHELQELDSGATYVIGGIVDHNRHKNLTLEKAERHGVATARLPIGRVVQLTTSKVLTVNHVLDIILRYLEHRDWSVAVTTAVPQRKKAVREASGSDDAASKKQRVD